MYNIKAVSKMLDMPTVTIRSWENRYNAVIPKRTDSGHRVYTEEDIEDLKWIKKQLDEKGLKVSQSVKLLHKMKKDTKEIITKEDISTAPKEAFLYTGVHIKKIYEAVKNGDAESCNTLLDLCFSQFHYREVFFSIVPPLMQQVGDDWENGKLSVAHEHMISNIVYQRFSHFFRIFPISPKLPKVIALCPTGEDHQLGLLLFSLFLRENGFEVIYLGPNTPLEGLREIMEQQDVKLVCFSISKPILNTTVENFISEMIKYNDSLQFIIGGTGVKETNTVDTKNKCYLSPNYHDWEDWLKNWSNEE
ncbi:MerR family transcriptional regulator [Evansella sp. AB-rgal1]|uniref:MerR family transcriptional regulator n=1 Tax=Evansella sp. AB-rgal1 TaxID=3242696 RepID=UPI00359DAC33